MNNKALGQRIQKYRMEKNLTAEHFAEIVELSTSMVREIERGNKLPSLPSLVRIANALGVSSDELLCDSVDKAAYITSEEIRKEFDSLSADDMTLIKVIVTSISNELKRRKEKAPYKY